MDATLSKIISAKANLRHACELYCGWFDKGEPQMDGSAMAYELVSFVRTAILDLDEIKKQLSIEETEHVCSR